MTLSVYLAARFSRRSEMRGYAAELAEHGIAVTSRWIVDGAHSWAGTPDDQIPEHVQGIFAEEDRLDIEAADMVLVFTDRPSTRGGMWVELGVAIGRRIPVIVVGPVANIFCALPEVARVPDWDAALHMLLNAGVDAKSGSVRTSGVREGVPA